MPYAPLPTSLPILLSSRRHPSPETSHVENEADDKIERKHADDLGTVKHEAKLQAKRKLTLIRDAGKYMEEIMAALYAGAVPAEQSRNRDYAASTIENTCAPLNSITNDGDRRQRESNCSARSQAKEIPLHMFPSLPEVAAIFKDMAREATSNASEIMQAF
ncbi:MAG: hypothetical protein Q9162_003465 [Coniocarpon cinnabarinum]